MSIITVVLISIAFLLTNGQHNPHFKQNRRAIVQLFEWKFVDVANECETFLSKHNFAGVQVKFSLVKLVNYFIEGTAIRYHRLTRMLS